jgi:hypothetical protein
MIGLTERAGLAMKRRGAGRFHAGRLAVDLALYPSDVHKIVSSFKAAQGRAPRLFRPQTFNDWLQATKLFRRRKRNIAFADKLLAREFVKERVGDSVLTKIFWVGRDLREAKSAQLPPSFVIKANNGSGTNTIVTDASKLDWDKACLHASWWLNEDHSTHFAEWQYRWIEPRLFIEEYLEVNGTVPPDYKFFCFNGRVGLIQVDVDRFGHHTRAMMDRAFSPTGLRFQYPTPDTPPPKPSCLPEMVEVAEHLSRGERFVRVDLYDIGRPIFGEITLHPEAGNGVFDPPEWGRRLLDFL